MICPNCGKELPSMARFCAKCGTRIAEEEEKKPKPAEQTPVPKAPPVPVDPTQTASNDFSAQSTPVEREIHSPGFGTGYVREQPVSPSAEFQKNPSFTPQMKPKATAIPFSPKPSAAVPPQKNPSPDAAEEASTPKPSKRKKWMFYIPIGVVAALVVAVAGVLLSDRIKPEEEAPIAVETEQTESTEAETVEEVIPEEETPEERVTPVLEEKQEELQEPVADDSEESAPEKNLRPQIDVEQTVLTIRNQYDEAVENMNSGAYRVKKLDGGMCAYYDGDELCVFVVPRGACENTYSQSFYYKNGTLYFAYYEDSDAHRLYFYDGYLIRWRYAESASAPQNAVNHDLEENESYLDWEQVVLRDSAQYVLLAEQETASDESEYILPDSDTVALTKEDLAVLTAEECCLARNEIFARHGRIFKNPNIASYFESKSWYSGTIDGTTFDSNTEKYLSELERKNISFIVQYEKATFGGSYY